MIEIKVRSDQERIWECYLRNKYKSKAKISKLVRLLIIEAVAEQARKELNEMEK